MLIKCTIDTQLHILDMIAWYSRVLFASTRKSAIFHGDGSLWALQQNYAVLPKTIKIPRLRENFDFSFSIQDSDMDMIKLENKGGGITWEWGDPLLVD